MNIQKLKLSHFRNYDSASFSFDPDTIHVLYGRNAQGKTNLLEAIYYLSHLRSWRTSKSASLISYDADAFVLECQAETGGRKEELKAVFNSQKKFLYRFDKPVSTFSSFVGLINAVLFCPDDLMLFSAPPKNRRQFIDMELVKLSRTYTGMLSRFQKLLKERNTLLKAWPVNRLLVDTISSQMVDCQEVIIKQRSSFLKSLEEEANKILPLFSNGAEHLRIRYKTCVDPDGDIGKSLTDQYASSWEKDRLSKTTSVGIHKDDIEFYLEERLITQTASQGQRRSVMLALKLGLCAIIQQKSGQYPVLLLDDVFSELDDLRRQRLIQALPEQMQIFITSAEAVSPSWFVRPAKFYTVEHGVMKEGLFDV